MRSELEIRAGWKQLAQSPQGINRIAVGASLQSCNYIKGQEEHHRHVSFKDELRQLLINAGVEFDETYLD